MLNLLDWQRKFQEKKPFEEKNYYDVVDFYAKDI